MDEDQISFFDPFSLEDVKVDDDDLFGECRSVIDFEKLGKIGEGSYGIVYKAKEINTNDVYALKKIKINADHDGIPLTTLREINILMNIKHDNVVNLREVVVGRKLEDIYLVMDYCEGDLASFIDNMSVPFAEPQIKCILLQLFEGINHLHQSQIVHRDLKMSNLLLNDKGIVKIADFGMSRVYSDSIKKMTGNVVTIWYRSPEVLFGANTQTFSTDIWSCGCIMGELLLNEPLLPGKNEIHQIELIVKLMGTPNADIWPDIVNLSYFGRYNLLQQPFSKLKNHFATVSSACYRILNSIFVYDPTKRISAYQCLQSSYFVEDPIPCQPCHLPVTARDLD